MEQKVAMKPIPEYGDLMTLGEFISTVECGGFIDYDGYGYYATETQVSDLMIVPSHVKDGNVIQKGFTHVVWFNR